MVEIIPSLLTSSPEELRTLLSRLEAASRLPGSRLERVQVDVVDGVFADNRTIEPSVLEDSDTNLNLDFHLMVKEPINWVEKCARAGADRIIGQIEMMESQIDFLGKVQGVGAEVGLAIDLETPVSRLDALILTNLDVVLVMSVRAGFGGQKFDDRALEKIEELDEIRARDNTPFRICDDGGISLENIYSEKAAGVDEVVVGRSLFAGDLAKNLEKFEKAMYKNIE